MSRPRCVFPGRSYLITRRCSERRFFLKPSGKVNEVFLYCLAAAAERHGVKVHGFVVMSNHYHLLLTDVRGELPDFCHLLNAFAARQLNAAYGRFGSFWEPGSYSAVRVVDPEDVIEKFTYVMMNPVEAGLVPHGVEWPGLISSPRHLLEGPTSTRRVYRPLGFFVGDSKMPAVATLTLTCPPALRHYDRETLVDLLQQRREAGERDVQERMEKRKFRFLGKRAILAQRHSKRPSSKKPRFQLSPTIACSNKWKRIEMLQELKAWRSEYREAYERFRVGDRGVEFPPGTWGPVKLYGARAAPATAA